MISGSVPHSGNLCSGLCRTPCDHPSCWQCVEVKDKAAVEHTLKNAMSQLQALTADHRTKAQKAYQNLRPGDRAKELLANHDHQHSMPTHQPLFIPAPAKAQDQKTTITRGALEALCEKAGIRMDWNLGEPVFYDDSIQDRERKYTEAQRKILEEKVKELEHIAAQQNSGILSAQTANSMAKAAGQQMNSQVSDILKRKVEETLVADAVANEATAIAKLKSNGASDDDIEAARSLMGWKPGEISAFVADPLYPSMQGALDPAQVQGVLTAASLQRAIEGLKAMEPPPIVIVHPSFQSQVSDLIQKKMRETLTTNIYPKFKLPMSVD